MPDLDLYLSKSSIETFNQCPLKFDFRYVQKVKGEQKLEDRASAIFGTLIHEVLETYFKNGKTDDIIALYKSAWEGSELNDQEKYVLGETLIHDYLADVDNGNVVLDVEKDFKLFLDNGVPVKGFIDRIDKISDTEIEIIDYKTGYSLPLTPKQLEYDLQLGIYNLAANSIYPEFETVKLSLYYLHYGKISCYKTKEQLQTLKNYLSVTYNKVKKAVSSGETPEGRENSYCSYCDYKAKCLTFKSIVQDPDNAVIIDNEFKGIIARESGLVVDLNKVDVLLERVKAKQKVLKKLEFEVKDFIKGHIKEHGTNNRVKIGNTSYQSASKKYTTYDVETVMGICKEKGIDQSQVLKATKTEVDKKFKKDQEAMKKLSTTSRVSYSEPYLR